LFDAHDGEITWLQFVPNDGMLVSLDDTNLMKIWKLDDLEDC